MKKKLAFLMACMLFISMLSGCCLRHEWMDATCENPQTCSKCDKTKGEALGHSWDAATCEAPETCARCNSTKGSALGHKYNDWSVNGEMMERTCSTCRNVESTEVDREVMAGILLEGRWEGYQILHSGSGFSPVAGDYVEFTRDGDFEQQFNNGMNYGTWTYTRYVVTEKTSAYWGTISMNGKTFSFLMYDYFNEAHPQMFALIVGDYIMMYTPA